MGVAESHTGVDCQSGNLQPGVDEVFRHDPVWVGIENMINERSKAYTSKYKFNLRVKKLWRVRMCGSLQQQEAEAKLFGEPTQLFHGTSMENALKIAKSGFQIPTKKGMFGRGVYFADTPLKSANFAPENLYLIDHVQRFAKKGLQRGLYDMIKGRREVGQMLLCDVYLGRTKTLRRACNNFDPEIDLKGGWFRELVGLGDYNSACAPGGWFGAVNVPEYIVYQPHQGVPKYLIEFEYEYGY